MFKSFGIWEIVLILAIVLIIFGVGKLPQVGNAIGKGLRSFKKAQSGEEEADEKDKGKKADSASNQKAADDKVAKS